MASSGYTDVKVTDWDTLRFKWEVSNQSIASNTSTVSWEIQLIAGTYGRIDAGGKSNWEATVNGNSYSGAENIGIGNNQTKTLASGSTVISHNSDGDKSFSYSFSQDFYITFAGKPINVISGSGSGDLPFIARTSNPELSETSADMGTSVTITTNRQSTAITHDLAYSFAGGSYVTFATGVGDSYSWTVPDLAIEIPNAASGVCTIRCITKSGSTTVGKNTLNLTIKVPDSVVPTISSVTVAEATEGLAARFGFYVQHKSTVSVSVKASGAKGSSVTKYLTYVIGQPYDGNTFTSGPLLVSGNQKIVVNVYDSRGRTAQKEIPIYVTAYNPPIISEFGAVRCDENGVEDEKGVCLKLSYNYKTTDLSEKNTAEMVIEYKKATETSYAGTLATSSELAGSGTIIITEPTFSLDYQYDLRMTVSDLFGPGIPYVVAIRSEEVILDISGDGKGLAFFRVSQRPGIEIGKKMLDEYDALIGNGQAAESPADDHIDANATLEHICVTDKNTPTSELWYIITIFGGDKSAAVNRAQYALPYNHHVGGAPIYTRVFSDGFWLGWNELPTKTADYDTATGSTENWHVRMWSDGWVECTGIREVTDIACSISAGGGWYKSYEFTPGTFPVEIENPVVSINFESNGSGALMVPTTYATTTRTAKYYFTKPSSTAIANGKVIMRVSGRIVELQP